MPPVWKMSLCAVLYCLKATDACLALPCAFPSSVIRCETFLLASLHGLITPSADYSITYSHFLSPSQSSPYLGQSSQLSTTSHCLILSVIFLSFLPIGKSFRLKHRLVHNTFRNNINLVLRHVLYDSNPYTAPHLWCYLLLAQKSNTILQA